MVPSGNGSCSREDDALCHLLFDEMPGFVSVQDRERRIVRTNRRFRERFGDGLGRRCWEVCKQRIEDCESCPVVRTFETGEGQQAEERVTTLDGGEIPIILYTQPIRNDGNGGADGEADLVLLIGADISDVKRLQHRLHQTQKRLRQLFDESPCYISVQDRELKLTAVNRRFREDFGDEIGHPCYEVYKHRDEPCLECPVMRTFEDGQPHTSEEVVTSCSGDQHNVFVHTAPLRDDRGEVSQVMEMSTNITQIRQLQSQLTSLGLLISSISHGAKGLLTAVDGGTYLVNSGLARDDRVRVEQGWDIVQRNVRRVRSMVLDMLYYAKERDLAYERLHALDFAAEVWELVSPRAEELSVTFDRDFDARAGHFEADASALRSALINILENAFDACRLDRKKDAHRVSLRLERERDHLVFVVTDNGIGMDRETADRVFTLFFSSKGNEGTGLGLFVSHKIVRQHGGHIDVASTPGEGTRFRVRVPVRRPREKDAATGARPAAPSA